MPKVPANRKPYKQPPPKGRSIKTVSDENGIQYRSKFESRIHEQNPFLIYEARKYPVHIVQFNKVPFKVVEETSDGRLIIPVELVTKGRRSKDLPEYVTVTNQIPDWVIPARVSATGREILVESKGLLSFDDCYKIRAFRLTYPDLDYRMVFMSNNRVAGLKSMPSVLDWAKSCGIPAVVGTYIPDEWLKDGVRDNAA